jgi:hypothetical protein
MRDYQPNPELMLDSKIHSRVESPKPAALQLTFPGIFPEQDRKKLLFSSRFFPQQP